MLLEGPAVRPSPEKLSEMIPAVLSERPANVATPPATVTAFVPWSVPLPLASDTVTTVAVIVRHEVAVRVFQIDTGWMAKTPGPRLRLMTAECG